MEQTWGRALGAHLLAGAGAGRLARSVRSLLGGKPGLPTPEATGASGRLRAPRVRIRPLHEVGFLRELPWPAGPVSVANVSVTGIALILGAAEGWPEPGGELAGTLTVGSASFAVDLRIVHRTHDVVGCGFVSPSRALTLAIQAYLAADLEALAMAYVPPRDLAAEPDGEPHWFHGHNNSELYLVERRGAVIRFRLTFFANYLEGGEGRPVRFGVVTRERDLSRDERDSVRWLPMINAEQLAATLRFIAAIPGLRPGQRDGILHHIC